MIFEVIINDKLAESKPLLLNPFINEDNVSLTLDFESKKQLRLDLELIEVIDDSNPVPLPEVQHNLAVKAKDDKQALLQQIAQLQGKVQMYESLN